jgi:putative addiction module killer protein
MKIVRETATFSHWLLGLRERVVRARIQARILRLRQGNPGKHRVLTAGVVELKIDVGPGYRVYYTERNGTLIVLLCGGDKATQQDDIRSAIVMAENL